MFELQNFKVQDGIPPLGSFVKVKWPDGVTYNGHFQGTRSVKLYTVSNINLHWLLYLELLSQAIFVYNYIG